VTRVALALGANLGDSAATLQSALDALGSRSGLRVRGVSSVFETDAVGGPEGQPAFLNAVVVADAELSARDLLTLLHQIESRHGRIREVHWGPRTLDLDLLAYGAETSQDSTLTLPHPRAHERAFVLVPWAEVDPAFEVPGRGPVAALLAGLGSADLAGVRRRDDIALTIPVAQP
jgi:2-amino-4-hydroxy-6-hydroxymethyldihydropteridine diphosphokinase